MSSISRSKTAAVVVGPKNICLNVREKFSCYILLSEHVIPKNPSLHIQTKASMLMSMQEPPFSHDELLHASVGAVNKLDHFN